VKLNRYAAARARWAKDPRAKARGGFFVMLVWYVIVFALSEILRPKPKLENAKPAGLGDFQFPTATEERFVPLLWGTIQITGPNVVWWGNLVQEAIREKVKTGLFSSATITKGYSYQVGIQSALCRGVVDELRRVWIGDDLVGDFTSSPIEHGDTFTIDEPELFGGDDLGNGGVVGTLKFFSGTNTQAVSSYLAQFQQVGVNNRTPAYRGTCYICSDDEPVYVGNSTSIKPWKYELQRIPNGLALGSGGAVNTLDANPANVIYEILTDTDWGLAIDPAKVDTSNLAAAGETLATEGNGFSYLQDTPIEAAELIALVEEQISGILFFNQLEGQFQITLARADYDVGDIPHFDDDTILEFSSFARGSWEDTSNYVRCQFNDRADDYKGTFGLAIDSANIRIQDGAIIVATRSFPGVKDKDLANDLAWRDLRTLAVPLAKASIKVETGAGYTLQPGQTIAITNADLGITDLAMRITRVDYGDLTDNRIHLDLVEDVFYYLAASFGAPIDSGWVPPADTLLPFLTAETIKMECPRAFNARDPQATGPDDNRILVGARRRGIETVYRVMTKLDGASDTAYVESAIGIQFLKIGELTSSLATTGATPASTINVTCTPDAQAAILAAFDSAPAASILGLELSQLIMIGNELMLVQDAAVNAATVDLQNVYRGVCDTTREAHSAGVDVFILSSVTGNIGAVTVGPFGSTQSIDIKLLPKSPLGEVALASATEEEVDMAKRSRRPYPPGRVTIGASSEWNSTVSLEQLGGAAESTGFATSWIRRDYRSSNGLSEIDPLTTDAATLFGDFPGANSTEYEVRLRNDPAGANTLLLTYSGLTGTSQNQLRLAILQATGGVLPTTMRLEIEATHTDTAEVLDARYTLRHDFAVTSALSGQFAFGALDTNITSNLYTATVAGTYAFSLSSAFSAGDVEYRLNGGAWTALITAGNTSGSILGVVISDTIEVRHTSSDVGALKQLDMNAAGAGQDAFAVLYV